MTATTNAQVPASNNRIIRGLLNNIVWVIFIALMVFFSIFIDGFFSFENYRNILYHSVFIGVLAIAETIVLISGHMDLSVESTAAGAAIIGVWLAGASQATSGLHLNTGITFAIILALGALIGSFNAFFIVRLELNSFLVTLATYVMIRGLAVVITKGIGMADLPGAFRFVDTTKLLTIPLMIYILILLYVVFELMLRNTRFGKHLYILGGNVDAAYNFGINVKGSILRVFILSGLISAVTGWLMAARVNGANAGIGNGFIFEVLAAVVIGGVGLTGGVGSLVGVFAGTLILGAIHNAINITAISPFYTTVIRGALILVAISLDAVKRMFR
jgi:ribose transport system permease protein